MAECVQEGDTMVCSGDLSSGVRLDTRPPGVNTLSIRDLTGPINGGMNDAVRFSGGGSNVIVSSGTLEDKVIIETSGGDARGIVAKSIGSPASPPESSRDPYLGVFIVDDPDVPGGRAEIVSHSDITTGGDGAHGIYAHSGAPGYGAAVIDPLKSFDAEKFSYTVIEVSGQSDLLGQQVAGVLIDADGNPILDPDGKPIMAGSFTIRPDGSYLFARNDDFDGLGADESLQVAVDYTVSGENADGVVETASARLIATVGRDEKGNFRNDYIEAYFERYGVSVPPEEESLVQDVFPDLQGYVGRLLATASAGSSGGLLAVQSDGEVITQGPSAHGIYAYSQGGAGAGGCGGSISHSACPGKPGKSPGAVTVTADGRIETQQNYSLGIMALSAGGAGGPGGNGGVWRHGQKGGTGADGGTLEVTGGAEIVTHGDYASGIVALSVGGNGGRGGSGSGAMPGGGGGFGGKGGTVIVDGTWDVTTGGDMAHGLWAKSLGGNAGDGGSGGWLFGDPGKGGVATDGGQVSLTSGGEVKTFGTSAYGLYAQSVGGFGGSGGSSFGLFWSFGGDAESGGSGGAVAVHNLSAGRVITDGNYSHAILAQSVGGGGGSGGGEFSLIASLGGSGASGGNGGTVNVVNDGWLETHKLGSFGISAQSVGGGGGDGGSVTGLVAIGGDGSQTSDGGDVTVVNRGQVTTYGGLSHAIFAESVGGGGGNGGRSGGLFAIGGDGGSGGDAGAVTVTNVGTLYTVGDESYGIFAQSVGGGGGSGGGAVSLSPGALAVAIGGKGEAGGHGSSVTVDGQSGSSITTEGKRSYGVFAQSVGGGGGDGGFAITAMAGNGVTVAVGGKGEKGGNAGTVTVNLDGAIKTAGEEAYGIFAQSVGGGGGAGGFTVAGSVGGAGFNLGLGGGGGDGGIGSVVKVGDPLDPITGTITTSGLSAHGIMAQSVGGGGGAGGFSIAGSIGGGISTNLAIGGDGGAGNSAGAVSVDSLSTIVTTNDGAHGIFAQSVGGSGGSGGFTIAGSLLGPASISLGFGGKGGNGSLGGTVDVTSGGDIFTFGQQSHGILAQSVGGGGGAGGLSIAGGVTAFGGLSLAMGGDGGEGGNAGDDVTVVNRGRIETADEYAYGIFAQSVGGGGGAGGSSGAVMVNFSSLIPIPEPYPTGSVNIAVSLGGDGGGGGSAGRVSVENAGGIITHKDFSYGILAQSVGGGGGDGGKSIAATANISAPGEVDKQVEVQVDFAMAIGGKGNSGGEGNEVTVSNEGTITTSGDGAHGIFAQSVGGGGGSGGDARSMILSIDPSNWSASDPPPDPTSISVGATLSLGGDGGKGGHGGVVNVTNTGLIETRGADAYGILAQSVGGGGGLGGGGYHGLDWQDFGVPEELEPFLDLLPVQDEGDLHIAVGGKGGDSSNGQKVWVENSGQITTYDDGSIGVLAQSVGGGGGLGGVGAVGDGESSTVSIGGSAGAGGDGGMVDVNLTTGSSVHTYGVAAHGIFAQSVGGGGGYAGNADRGLTDFGLNFALGGNGGAGGDGGDVSVRSEGDIITEGLGAIGIYAQSVGGGGGLAGGVGEGFGFSGSVGDKGDAGLVEVVHTGNITTYGENAHGIVAQSVGGADYGGEVHVRVLGDITVNGAGALAVIAQSEGGFGKKNIEVTYEGGTIMGNSEAAVRLLDGVDNTFTNHGTIMTFGGPDGYAMIAGAGNETIKNHGLILGSLILGAGSNAFYNNPGGTLASGREIQLGSGNLLTNAGRLSPGGTHVPFTTTLTGDLMQTSAGALLIDVDLAENFGDRLELGGAAALHGQVEATPVNAGYAKPGGHEQLVLSAAGGVTENTLELGAPRSAVVGYRLVQLNPQEIAIRSMVDFSPDRRGALSRNARQVAEHVNAIQSAGGSESFAPIAAALVDMPDDASLNSAYEQLISETAGGTVAGALTGSLAFNDAMHSCRQREGDYRFLREGECVWARVDGFTLDQERTSRNPGYQVDTVTVAGGRQLEVSANTHFGFGLSYQASELDAKLADSDGSRVEAGVILKRRHEAMMLSISLSAGYGWYDNERSVDLPTAGVTARSDLDMIIGAVHGRWSYDFEPGGDYYLRPLVDLGFTRVHREGFTEKGAGGADLEVEEETDLFMTVQPAFEVGGEHLLASGTLVRPFARAGVTHFLSDNKCQVTATFKGAPDGVSPFTTETEGDRTFADLALGVDLIRSDSATLRLDYTGQFSENSASHVVGAKLAVPF